MEGIDQVSHRDEFLLMTHKVVIFLSDDQFSVFFLKTGKTYRPNSFCIVINAKFVWG